MKQKLINVLIFIACLFAGAFLNGAIISISHKIIPPPQGTNLKTLEGLKASMHLMQPIHFAMPFLAHALGTLLAAFLASKFIATNKLRTAMIAAILFFIGGLANIIMLPSPTWFTILDLVGAYFPMAWIGNKLATLSSKKSTSTFH